MTTAQQESRTDRRKAQTRGALLRAAQAYLAEGNTAVAVLDITKRADVGLGSFYNHFASKDELFDAAVESALELHADLLDVLVPEEADPAHVFAQRFRLTGRIHQREPELSKVVLSRGVALMSSNLGFTPRARRDISRAIASGRFTIADVDVAMVMVFGAAIALGQLLLEQPERDGAETTDEVTEGLLVMLGMTRAQARKLARTPLPELPDEPRTS